MHFDHIHHVPQNCAQLFATKNQPNPARIQLNPPRLQQRQLNPTHVHPTSSCIRPDHPNQSNPSCVHPNLPPQNQQKPLRRSTRKRNSPSRLNL